jgi:hypothetical protein
MIITIVEVVAILLVGLSGSSLLAAALWPERLQHSKQVLTSLPLRCALIGVLAVLIEVWLALAVGSHARGPVVGMLGLVDLGALALGFPALAQLAGERLGAISPLRAIVTGAVVIAIACMLPLVGWALGGVVVAQSLGAPVVAART